jgi:hypothetical protein
VEGESPFVVDIYLPEFRLVDRAVHGIRTIDNRLGQSHCPTENLCERHETYSARKA